MKENLRGFILPFTKIIFYGSFLGAQGMSPRYDVPILGFAVPLARFRAQGVKGVNWGLS
jgi:hypothetical protein